MRRWPLLTAMRRRGCQPGSWTGNGSGV